MAIWPRVVGALVCGWLTAAAPGVTAFEQTQTGDAELADAVRLFDQGVARYVALRARLSEPLPAFDERRDPWSLMLTRRYLASTIRAARSTAQQGDIFTPRVAAVFRVLVTQAVYDEDIEGMLAFDWQSHDSPVDLVANEPLPISAMRTVPRTLLARLPPLPDAIEYRLVNGALILWDGRAEILIDWLPDPVLTD